MEKIKVALVGLEWDLVDLVESIETVKLAGLIDRPSPNLPSFIPYLGSDEDWGKISAEHPDLKTIITVDRFADRVRLAKIYGKSTEISLISPHAYISPHAKVGLGNVVQRGVKIMPQATVGHFCKINVNATVHHESKVGDFCTLAPGSQVLGRVILEEGVYVGAGAVIRQNCRIGKGAFIGAGAVVVKDIPSYQTVIGVPARELLKK